VEIGEDRSYAVLVMRISKSHQHPSRNQTATGCLTHSLPETPRSVAQGRTDATSPVIPPFFSSTLSTA